MSKLEVPGDLTPINENELSVHYTKESNAKGIYEFKEGLVGKMPSVLMKPNNLKKLSSVEYLKL